MSTIDLTCPACGEAFAVDGAFAGGVCRCAGCGSMIDVGARAKSVPGGGAQPGSGATTPPRPRARVQAAAGGGRPVPRPRTRPHRGRLLPWSLALTLVFAAVAVLLVVLQPSTRGGDDASLTGTEARQQALGFDPDANPFLVGTMTFLGLPVAENTALVIDCSSTRQPWMRTLREVLRRMRRGGVPASCFVVAAREEGPLRLGKRWVDLEEGHLDGLVARGLADLARAVDVALEAGAKSIIIVAGRPVYDDETDAIARVLGDVGEGVVLHAMSVDVDDTDSLAAAAEARGGYGRRLTQRRIDGWLEAQAP